MEKKNEEPVMGIPTIPTINILLFTHIHNRNTTSEIIHINPARSLLTPSSVIPKVFLFSRRFKETLLLRSTASFVAAPVSPPSDQNQVWLLLLIA
ncbi:hypothetical protein L1987_17099 [Smallanthus sonchifolius]|uniref:Uncharacterized protein n=1 Tax=Smallanthus sonchifolius TaxID=185202 RepID=A0ACB9IWB8_9ASTR|nr:hypothetical protein L1987_17099 [Smallanthus sonchifolius]